jgi:starvation-inducible DNA-binding protein
MKPINSIKPNSYQYSMTTPDTESRTDTTQISPSIGLTEKSLARSVQALVHILADQHVLYQKLRNFHWNLTGERFHTLHEFYEKQYEALAADIDATAERIRMMGGVAPGSMREMLDRASLHEAESALIDGSQTIVVLVADHEACATSVRAFIEAVEDEGTKDFLTGLLRAHEQAAWMLRSFLR